MNTEHLAYLFILLSIIIIAGRLGGALASKFNFPQVVGELLMGFVIGASGLGNLFPSFLAYLTPTSGPVQIGLNFLEKLGILLFLIMAGSEIHYSQLRSQGRKSLTVGAFGFFIPFILSLSLAWLLHIPQKMDRTTVLFFATALSVSALPVLARTLMELKVYTSKLSSIMIGAAMIDDLAAWTIFTVISRTNSEHSTEWLTLAKSFFVLVLLLLLVFAIKQIIDKKYQGEKAEELKAQNAVALLAPYLAIILFLDTQNLLHANFGAFLFGIIIAGTPLLGQQTHTVLHSLVYGFFAPLFFTSVGLMINLQEDLILSLTLGIIGIAFLSKILSGYLGSRIAGNKGLPAWTIAWGLNSRGAMQILLATLALQKGIINRQLFVSLVLMAIVTTACSGWAVRRFSTRGAFAAI